MNKNKIGLAISAGLLCLSLTLAACDSGNKATTVPTNTPPTVATKPAATMLPTPEQTGDIPMPMQTGVMPTEQPTGQP